MPILLKKNYDMSPKNTFENVQKWKDIEIIKEVCLA